MPLQVLLRAAAVHLGHLQNAGVRPRDRHLPGKAIRRPFCQHVVEFRLQGRARALLELQEIAVAPSRAP